MAEALHPPSPQTAAQGTQPQKLIRQKLIYLPGIDVAQQVIHVSAVHQNKINSVLVYMHRALSIQSKKLRNGAESTSGQICAMAGNHLQCLWISATPIRLRQNGAGCPQLISRNLVFANPKPWRIERSILRRHRCEIGHHCVMISQHPMHRCISPRPVPAQPLHRRSGARPVTHGITQKPKFSSTGVRSAFKNCLQRRLIRMYIRQQCHQHNATTQSRASASTMEADSAG